MILLGLNYDMLISSAALISDGEIIAAAAEERFSREKHTRAFPRSAIDFCLDLAGIKFEEVSAVASAWNPSVYFAKFNPLFSGQRRWKAEQLYSLPDNLLQHSTRKTYESDYFYQRIGSRESGTDIYYITHHRAHAANAFYLSPFEEAAILTADSQGEWESTTFGRGEESKISILKSLRYPQSIGMLYAAITDYLGFKPNSDEWKVMALGSYANADGKSYKIMKKEFVRLLPKGEFELNLTYFNGFNNEQPNLYTQKMVDMLGPARENDQELEERHYDIAAALQRVTEETVFHMLFELHKKLQTPNLTIAGGVFMNAVLNGKISNETPFENVFISSCPDDSGNSLGAALYLNNNVFNKRQKIVFRHNYLGPQFSNHQISKELEKFKIRAEYVENVAAETAKFLENGLLVGWFQGRMEFGQRALGNRSILADPRSEDTKELVNNAVKFREGFRPFAPSVLNHHVSEYFEVDEEVSVPFMEKVATIRLDKRQQIPAVTHVDNTGRLQTVDRETNPLFFSLLCEFYEITGVPVLLNTSFNLNGEPVVCTPQDALRTFFSCGLDILVIGNFVVFK